MNRDSNMMLLLEGCQEKYSIHITNFTEIPKLVQTLNEYHQFETAKKFEEWYDRLLYHHAKEYDEVYTKA